MKANLIEMLMLIALIVIEKKALLKVTNNDIKENIIDIFKSLLDTYRMSYNLAKQSFYYVKENKKDVITFIEDENG